MSIFVYSNQHYNFNDAHFNKIKHAKLTEKQISLLIEMESGWLLYRNPQDFNWFLYKARHKPYIYHRKTVYGPTAESLIQKNILIKKQQDSIGILYVIRVL